MYGQENLEPGDRDALAVFFAEICIRAGAPIMDVYAGAKIAARAKNDASPVTDADERAEALLLDELARRLPLLPVVAEERASCGDIPACGDAFLLVDPLDGTREFIERRNEFTVNVALIENGAPIAGAVYAPALGRVWFAGARAHIAEAAPGAPLPARENWRELRARRWPERGATALASRSHLDVETESFLARLPIAERINAGSSIKFCRLAEGVADVYPRFGPTMEWDTAAGDAVLRAAGGAVLTPEGDALRYGKTAQNFRNGPFIAYGDPAFGRSDVAKAERAPI